MQAFAHCLYLLMFQKYKIVFDGMKSKINLGEITGKEGTKLTDDWKDDLQGLGFYLSMKNEGNDLPY